MFVLNNVEEMIKESIKLQKTKEELDSTESMSQISDIVDSLSESEAKKLLKMYIYDR